MAPLLIGYDNIIGCKGPKISSGPVVIDPTWLWLKIPGGGTVTFTKVGSPTAVVLEYSLDNGDTWTVWMENGTTRTMALSDGQVMHIRNQSAVPTGFGSGTSDYYKFAMTSDAEAGGHIESLLCSDYLEVTEIPPSAFYLLFASSPLTHTPLMDCKKVVGTSYFRTYRYCTKLRVVRSLGMEDVTGFGAMRGMFQGCTSLESVPLLKAADLPQSGYREMFGNCSSLKEIRTMMTDISASMSLSGWVNGVAAAGDFYCPASLTIATGVDGIPSGWTRHDI